VHATGVPWNDPSGVRLRQWLEVDETVFYDTARFALVPMGFCYPGKGSSGDLPPRPECAPLWHARLRAHMPHVRLTLLLSQYSVKHYLGARAKPSVAETVRAWRDYAPDYIPLPHPSPRNNLWLRKHPWFESEVVPDLRRCVREALDD
jgi:uracil-DNA glycosylase